MKPCNHTSGTFVQTERENWITGNIDTHQEWVDVSLFEDLDLHRYQCAGCKTIFYYSERARKHFEEGVIHDIRGLDTIKNIS